jgi:SAM-dependent methyltransferase
MLPPRENYALLKKDALGLMRRVLSTPRKERLEDLFLALADYPVEVITPEDMELLTDNVRYWLMGYAVPVTALRELGIKDPERRSSIVLRGEDIAVEPDVNHDFARDFVSRVKGGTILDVASGFGWIPPLLSKRARVLAVDKAYLNRVVYAEERIHIENTTIELFPDSPTARSYLMKVRKLKDYRDFAVFFWKSHGAAVENIVPLQGDASDLRRCVDLSTADDYSVMDGSVDAVTCFFSFNHMPAWRSALEEVYRVLKDGGEAWVALYREYLQKFPVKFAYDWAEQLGIKIVEIKDFQEQARDLGFRVSPVKEYQGTTLYRLLRLKK